MVYVIKRIWLRLYSLREKQIGHSKYVSGNSALTPSTLNLKSPYFWLESYRTFSATSTGKGGACPTNWFKSSISLSPPTPRRARKGDVPLHDTKPSHSPCGSHAHTPHKTLFSRRSSSICHPTCKAQRNCASSSVACLQPLQS